MNILYSVFDYVYSLDDYYLPILITASIASTMCFISIYTRTRKFPIIEGVILLMIYFLSAVKPICVYGYGIVPVFKDNSYLPFAPVAITTIFILMFFLFVVQAIRLGKMRSNELIYQVVPSNVESSIYAYFTSKSKLMSYTTHLYNKVKLPLENKKPWYKQVEKIVCDLKTMTYREFLQYLRSFDEKKIDLTIEFDDYRVVDLKLQKVKIIENEKNYGYILVDQKLSPSQLYREGTKKEFKLQLHMFFDSLNEAVGYYDNDLDKYRLTEPMTVKLNITEQLLSIEELKGFIYEQDIPEFEKMLKQIEGNNTYRYRLKTVSGLEWQEEAKAVEDGVVYSVFRKAEFKYDSAKFETKKALNDQLKEAIAKKEQFGLIFMNLKRVNNIISKKGEEFSEMLIEKYFNSLEELTLKGKAKIFRLSKTEFCLYVADVNEYDTFLRNISNDVSDLIRFDLYSAGSKYRFNNAIGLVLSSSVQKEKPEAFVEAGFSALALASDPNYEKDYSIYFPKKDGDTAYKFEDYKVDIDNKFLDEI